MMIEFSDNASPWDLRSEGVVSFGLVKGVVQVLKDSTLEQIVDERVRKFFPTATHVFHYRATEIGAKESGLVIYHHDGARYFRFHGLAYRKSP